MESSVNDIVAICYDCLHLVNSYNVMSYVGSNQMPHEVNLSLSFGTTVTGVRGGGRGVKELTLLPRLKWADKDKLVY